MANVVFKVKKVMPPYKKYDKDFYPVSTADLRGAKGDYIFNCLVPIPADTKYVVAELYTYKGALKLKNVVPFNRE